MICGTEAPSLPRSVIGYCVPGSAAVAVVKGVAALRAELGRMCGVCRLPAAFVALIFGRTGGLGFAALGAELAFVHRAAAASPAFCRRRAGLATLRAELAGDGGTAAAGPAVRSGLRLRLFAAAFRAEFAGNGSAAAALPAVRRGGCGTADLLGRVHAVRTGLLAHGKQVLGAHAAHAACTGCHAHAHKAGHGTGGVAGGGLHGVDLTAHQTGGSGGGIGGHGVLFPLGDLLLLFLRDGQRVDVEGEHFNAALLAPDVGQLLVEGVRDLQRVSGDLVILHLVGGKGGQRRLQSVHQFALQAHQQLL